MKTPSWIKHNKVVDRKVEDFMSIKYVILQFLFKTTNLKPYVQASFL